MLLAFTTWLYLSAFSPAVEPVQELNEQQVVEKYLSATQEQKEKLKNVTMEIDIDARLPKLKKEGRFQALRFVSKLGQISFLKQAFTGDNTVKKEVIARYLSEEVKPRDEAASASLAITPANYKFKYKGLAQREGQPVHVLQLTPRKKAIGLFKGELWLDPETFLPKRETGRFVKNPSVFLKKVEFTRDYRIEDGLAIPSHIKSVIETRIAGKAEVNVKFANFQRVVEESISSDAVTPLSGPHAN